MCLDPVSLGLMAAGQIANMVGQRKVAKAQEKAYDAQVARNAIHQAAADQTMYGQVIPNFTADRQGQMLADAQAARLADSEALAGGGYDLPMADSASGDYKSDLAKIIMGKVQEGRDQAEAATRIGSYADLAFGNADVMTRGGLDIGRAGSNMEREAAILPYELQAAQSKGANYAMLGDLLSGAGTIYSLGGGADIFAKPAGQAAAPIIDKSVSMRASPVPVWSGKFRV